MDEASHQRAEDRVSRRLEPLAPESNRWSFREHDTAYGPSWLAPVTRRTGPVTESGARLFLLLDVVSTVRRRGCVCDRHLREKCDDLKHG